MRARGIRPPTSHFQKCFKCINVYNFSIFSNLFDCNKSYAQCFFKVWFEKPSSNVEVPPIFKFVNETAINNCFHKNLQILRDRWTILKRPFRFLKTPKKTLLTPTHNPKCANKMHHVLLSTQNQG